MGVQQTIMVSRQAPGILCFCTPDVVQLCIITHDIFNQPHVLMLAMQVLFQLSALSNPCKIPLKKKKKQKQDIEGENNYRLHIQ